MLTIEQLIEKLQDAKSKYDNIEVIIIDDDFKAWEVMNVEYDEDHNELMITTGSEKE